MHYCLVYKFLTIFWVLTKFLAIFLFDWGWGEATPPKFPITAACDVSTYIKLYPTKSTKIRNVDDLYSTKVVQRILLRVFWIFGGLLYIISYTYRSTYYRIDILCVSNKSTNSVQFQLKQKLLELFLGRILWK